MQRLQQLLLLFKSDVRSFFLMFFLKDSIFEELFNLLSSFDHIWGIWYRIHDNNIHSQVLFTYKSWTHNVLIWSVFVLFCFFVFLFFFLFFFFYSEYVKVIDGNGITVLSRYGYSSVTQKTFREVSFGNCGNITVQVYLRRSYSNFKLQFGILKQELG